MIYNVLPNIVVATLIKGGITMRFYGFIFVLCFPHWVQAVQDAADPYSIYHNTSDYDENQASPWVEHQVEIGGWPEDEHLTKLRMDKMPMNMTLYADLSHLTVGNEDYVTRLWLAVRSTKGAYNGTYEGFRCATGEYKIYAYANPERREPLRIASSAHWRKVKGKNYRHELMADYLCHDTWPRSPDAVAERLNSNMIGDETAY